MSLGRRLKGRPWNTTAQALLERAIGTFDFTDVRVGRNDVENNGEEIGANTFKLAVSMNVTDLEAAGLINGDDVSNLGEDSVVGAIGHTRDGAVLAEVPRD